MRLSFAITPIRLTACSLLLAATVACTTPPGESAEYDPWEPMNRGLFQVNYVIDGVVLKPITQVYRAAVPEVGREKVHNFVENLASPVTFANSVLQGDPENSLATLWRFLLNSTVGLGGLFDVASAVGLTNRKTDFGQTLALYGAESGPYLFLPILGPSSARDGVGRIGDIFAYPPTYINNTPVSIALWATTAINARSENYDLIQDVYRTSLDPYATFRSGYVQRRANDNKKARVARDKAWQKIKQQ